MGRSRKLNPAVIDELVEAAREGNPHKTCANLVVVAEGTLYEWLSKGRQHLEQGEETLEAELCERYTRARGEAEREHVGIVKRAAIDGDVKASMYWLDRRGIMAPQQVAVSGGLTLTHDTARQLLAEAARDLPDDDVGVDDDPVRAARAT